MRMIFDLLRDLLNAENLLLCDYPGTLKSMSTSSSWVDCCPPTGLTVLDNWVFGFGWIRWVSLLLPDTSESNSFIQLSLKEIVGGGRCDINTFSYIISPDSITTTLGIR